MKGVSMSSDKRYWCEVPTVKGGGCTRHTNWHVSVSVEDWNRAFPHDNDTRGSSGWGFDAYICGGHKTTLKVKGTATESQFTHLDGSGGLFRF